MDNKQTKQQLRQRERTAAEQLLNDSSLRENLDDKQADQLMNWGFDLLEKEVQKTASLAETQAEEKIGRKITHLKKVMHLLNEMVDQFAAADDKTASQQYKQILEELQYLQPVPLTVMQNMAEAVASRQRLGKEGTFQHLFTILKN